MEVEAVTALQELATDEGRELLGFDPPLGKAVQDLA